MKSFTIFDGNSIINRAFYGIRPLFNKDGLPTNALYGFLNIILKGLKETEATHVAVAFDMRAPTFRHIACESYKATRKGMPDDLAKQLPYAKQLCGLMGIATVEREGFEADDILGTLSDEASRNGIFCNIITGDRDSLQLVNENCTVRLAATNETKIYDYSHIKTEYGVEPPQLIGVKAIMGDSSDNIKGVPGIGEKGAITLIKEYGSLDNIYEKLDAITGSVKQKLIDGKESAYESLFLAEINKKVPINREIDNYLLKPYKTDELINLLTELEFKQIIERLDLTKQAVTQDELEIINISAADLISVLQGKTLAADINGDTLEIYCDGKLYNAAITVETAKIFNEKSNKILFWNIKDSLHILDKFNIEVNAECEDISLISYLVSNTDKGQELEKCAFVYLNKSNITAKSAIIFELYNLLYLKLKADDMLDLYENIEKPLSFVLFDMEKTGFNLDVAGLEKYGHALELEISQYEKQIHALAECDFNINSPKQLGVVLFENLKLPHGKKTQMGYSTDVDVLEKLREIHPIIDMILQYRQLMKLKGTYADGLLKVAGEDSRVRTTFKQTLTRTGRLSSAEPNLQNIPVRTQKGRELRAFFTSKLGYMLIDADYSQIELRVLAHISGDETLITSFLNEEDIHARTASQIFGVPINEVNGEMRKRAKAVNFGIVYGIGDFSLGQDIKVSKREAAEYIKNYLDKYPKVREYMDNIKQSAHELGYVTTLFGRRRYIPELSGTKKPFIAFGERVAMNTPIQGTAADIIKKAMIDTFNELKRNKMKSKLILQIHDELIIEAAEDEAAAAEQILRKCMENAFIMQVPLAVDCSTGATWFEAKE